MQEKRRKIITLVSAVFVLVLFVLLSAFVWNWFSSFSTEEFREYILSYGAAGPAVMFFLQFLQVFVAFIPGEFVESGAGYAFGPVWGTLICYAGVASASVLVFLLTRKFGVGLVELFVSRNKINELSFLKNEKKRDALVFLLFFIPGTPKDLVTYFVGLTDIKLGIFLILSLTARIPSVLSSTVGGHLLGEGKYFSALFLYGAVGLVSALGMIVYNMIIKRKRK